MNIKIKLIITVVIILLFVGGIIMARYFLFSSPKSEQKNEVFTVSQKSSEDEIVNKLKNQGFIRNKYAFKLILSLRHEHNKINPGGYFLSKDMNVWEMEKKLVSSPDMKWLVVPEGWRKEQVGELLAETFNWSEDDLNKWDTVYTKMKIDYLEGTYFPDTYLIPVNESGLDIANRMTRNFDEKFSPYLSQFAQQNIKWTTGLKLASIVQREAAGKSDMPIIAGILWNRLNDDINLGIDATVQYARGKTENGWWTPVTAEDIKNIDSPYNTYKNKGLPPYSIDSPGVDAIEAVLHPTETECLYYLHDKNREIHCAKTLEEHQANIDQYLKN